MGVGESNRTGGGPAAHGSNCVVIFVARHDYIYTFPQIRPAGQRRGTHAAADASSWNLAWGFVFGFEGLGLGFGVWGLGFGIWGVGLRVWGLGFWVWGLGFGVKGLGFGVLGLGFGVKGLGFRV